jgi:hypothetical protein
MTDYLKIIPLGEVTDRSRLRIRPIDGGITSRADRRPVGRLTSWTT